MSILAVTLTFFSTIFGGFIGLKYKNRLNLVLGFAAGTLLATIFLELFPEIFQLSQAVGVSSLVPMLGVLVGFVLFHILDKLVLLHPESEDVYNEHVHSHAGQHLGVLAAGALVFHSFLDGVGIGLAFHVSEAAGIIVAIAIIAHDFSDGMNTVALMLTHKNKDKPTITMLLADALAPVIGGVATLFVTIPQNFLLVYLSLFVGTLLYICTSEILPEAHRNKSSAKTLAMTVLGILFTLAVGLALAHSYS